jgi:hypothetical protein
MHKISEKNHHEKWEEKREKKTSLVEFFKNRKHRRHVNVSRFDRFWSVGSKLY